MLERVSERQALQLRCALLEGDLSSCIDGVVVWNVFEEYQPHNIVYTCRSMP
jgi:hypothetical protein